MLHQLSLGLMFSRYRNSNGVPTPHRRGWIRATRFLFAAAAFLSLGDLGRAEDLTPYPLAKDDWIATGTHWKVVDGGTLSVDFSKGAERLTSNPKFRGGSLEMELRFSRIEGVNYYLGFMSRDPWAANVVWLNNDGSGRFLLRTARAGKDANVSGSGTPALQPGAWHKFRIDWKPGAADRIERNPNTVAVHLDGKLLAEATSFDTIPDKAVPLVFDAIPQGEGVPGTLEVRNLRVLASKASVRREAILSAEIPVPRVTPTNPAPQPGTVRAATEERIAELENAFLRCRVDLAALRMTGLLNKFTGREMLSAPSRIFLINAGDRDLPDDGYRFVEAVPSNDPGESSIKAVWEHKEANVRAVLTLRLAADSQAVVCRLAMDNLADAPLAVGLTAPLLEHIQIAEDVAGDHVFFPFKTGICGSSPLHLRHAYGYMAYMQWLSVFDPAHGGSVSVFPMDATGTPKILVSNKRNTATEDPVVHTTSYFASETPGEIFGDHPGTALAVRHLRRSIATGTTVDFPEWSLSVGGSDWHDGFGHYSRWLRSWFQKRHAVPGWFGDTYDYISQHPQAGAEPSGGFANKDDSGYVYSSRMGPTEAGGLTEWFAWWDYPPDYKNPAGADYQITQYQDGDFLFNQRRGGLPAFREEIQRIHEKGGRIQLYTLAIALSDASETGRLHGAHWARKNEKGDYTTDWVAPGRGYNACLYVKGWREHFSRRMAEVLRESGADGYRLDVAALFYPCFNPEHDHYDGTPASSVSSDGMAEFIRLCSDRAREANPESAIMVEHAGSERLAQFHDGYLTQLFRFDTPFIAPLRGMSGHNLIFLRFLLPEVKVYVFGYDHEDAGRLAFFNAAGQDRGGVRGEALLQLQRMQAVLAENGDAVWGGRPEPLVPTFQEGLLANYFPGERKRIWLLWNRGSKAVEGDLLAVDVRQGVHYVEMLDDVPLEASSRDGRTVISGKLGSGQVACVAELPSLLQVRRVGNTIRIAVEGASKSLRLQAIQGREGATPPAAIPLAEGRAEFAAPADGETVLKLFSGNHLLDQAVVGPDGR